VRRVVVFLLALALAPSVATAARYQCAYDGATRSQCCCTTPTHHDDTPEQAPTARAACCCKVIQSAPVVRSAWSDPTPFELHAFIARIAVTILPVYAPSVTSTVVDRPRAQGDPPSSLFARHCSLLL
jgi:hypothetical protein